MKRLILIVIVAIFLVMAVPFVVGENLRFGPRREFVVVDYPHISFKVRREGPELQFYTLQLMVNRCLRIFNSKEMYAFNEYDSTFVLASPLHSILTQDEDCMFEWATYSIHAGNLRRIIEKLGLISFVVRGESSYLLFHLTEVGEKNLIKFIVTSPDSL